MYEINIKKLKIFFNNKILVDISLKLNNSTALIGQSGSGKTLTLKTILNLLPSTFKTKYIIESNFSLDSNSIGFIPQNPFTSLSPMTKIKDQFFCNQEIKEKALKEVFLDKKILNKFPAQLSGGQIQRIVIAMALTKDIKLLLLDEPTTALDENNKKNILKLIKNLQKKLNILILFVTHDIDSIIDICENVVIIKDGKVVEEGLTKDIINNPQRTYTKTLINSNFKNKTFRK